MRDLEGTKIRELAAIAHDIANAENDEWAYIHLRFLKKQCEKYKVTPRELFAEILKGEKVFGNDLSDEDYDKLKAKNAELLAALEAAEKSNIQLTVKLDAATLAYERLRGVNDDLAHAAYILRREREGWESDTAQKLDGLQEAHQQELGVLQKAYDKAHQGDHEKGQALARHRAENPSCAAEAIFSGRYTGKELEEERAKLLACLDHSDFEGAISILSAEPLSQQGRDIINLIRDIRETMSSEADYGNDQSAKKVAELLRLALVEDVKFSNVLSANVTRMDDSVGAIMDRTASLLKEYGYDMSWENRGIHETEQARIGKERGIVLTVADGKKGKGILAGLIPCFGGTCERVTLLVGGENTEVYAHKGVLKKLYTYSLRPDGNLQGPRSKIFPDMAPRRLERIGQRFGSTPCVYMCGQLLSLMKDQGLKAYLHPAVDTSVQRAPVQHFGSPGLPARQAFV